jgi:uncharacterized damage-inducible protein DinB
LNQKLERFRIQFAFDRALTIDLLQSLSTQELQWSPGSNVGEFWKQFRHVGRVQENYMNALDTGSVMFENRGSFSGGADGEALLSYLQRLNLELQSKLESIEENKTIDWFGQEQLTALDHLLRMMGHETLHHGQWIVYCKLMNKPFPKSWMVWGL